MKPTPQPKTHTPYSILHTPCGGFTLVELIVALSVSSVLIVLIFSSFLQLIKVQSKLLAFNHLQSTNNRILTQLKDDIRWGKVQLTPWSDNQLVIDLNDNLITYTWDGTVLTRQSGTQLEKLQPDNVDITEVNFENLTLDSNHFPLIRVLVASKPKSPQQQFLQLENQVTYTTKAPTYEL